jgi:hypothetical protein
LVIAHACHFIVKNIFADIIVMGDASSTSNAIQDTAIMAIVESKAQLKCSP